jgi:hypothetical protein
MHLTPDQFIDVAEGTQSEASIPHLGECRTCREELESVRAALSRVSVNADVPEPSPLFWDRLSADVRQRISTEPDPRSGWMAWLRRPLLVPLSAVAAVAVVIAVTLAPPTQVSPTAPVATSSYVPSTTSAAAVAEPSFGAGDAIDPMLTLVTDLSDGMDLEAAADAGFASPDAAEHAVTHLNADELRTLERLLRAELKRPGA